MAKSANTEKENQAFKILKRLRQVSEDQSEISVRLNTIMSVIAEEMGYDGVSCFVLLEENILELFATSGYNAAACHKVTVRIGEGLVGTVAKNCRPLVLSEAKKHPKYISKDNFKEEDYQSFIGVPLIRRHKAIGVLMAECKEERDYSRKEQETLETLAMFIADIVSSEEMQAYKAELIKSRGLMTKDKIKGLSLSKGYGLGQAVLHHRRHVVTKIFAEDKDKELDRLTLAHQQMNDDLDEKFNSTKLGLGEHTDILDAYLMFAKDKGWFQKIADNVMSGLTAEAAVERAYEDMWNRLSATQDDYLKERLHDLRDVSERLLSYLSGDYVENSKIVEESTDIIIVAQSMGPAELMDYDHTKIRGLLLEEGTPTMHVAIVAKALNIPVVAKIKGLYEEIKSGELIALDGNEGIVYLHPSEETQKKFLAKRAERKQLQEKLAALKNLPSQTLDGIRIGHYINVGMNFDLDYIDSSNCDGIGLYRTEIPFMSSSAMPNVEKQIGFYKELMDKAGYRKVIFRSLDVGSDKLLPYWAGLHEENPAIGWRSIRITLDRRAILRKQIRAFIEAAAGKELNVMFPMISNLAEFEESKETLLIEYEKIKRSGDKLPAKINVGLMIEVPSVVYQLDEILEQADFVSVGTNDLAQFFFACDRGNPRLSERYDVLSAPFLRMMKEIVNKANQHKVYCSVCGEMASVPIEAFALIGLGYRNLSSSGSAYGRVKSMIRSIRVSEIEDYMNLLLHSKNKTLRPQLMAYAYDHGVEIY